MTTRPLLVRLAGSPGRPLPFTLDGVACTGVDGDTVLTAVLAQGDRLRHTEFSASPRAGFCLMGACQDCWVWFGAAERGRACTTPVRDGMTVFTRPPHAGAGDG